MNYYDSMNSGIRRKFQAGTSAFILSLLFLFNPYAVDRTQATHTVNWDVTGTNNIRLNSTQGFSNSYPGHYGATVTVTYSSNQEKRFTMLEKSTLFRPDDRFVDGFSRVVTETPQKLSLDTVSRIEGYVYNETLVNIPCAGTHLTGVRYDGTYGHWQVSNGRGNNGKLYFCPDKTKIDALNPGESIYIQFALGLDNHDLVALGPAHKWERRGTKWINIHVFRHADFSITIDSGQSSTIDIRSYPHLII